MALDKVKIKDTVIDGGKNLSETAVIFGCTREYVRQVLEGFGINIMKLKRKNPLLYCRKRQFTNTCVICDKKFFTYRKKQKTDTRECLSALFKKTNARPCTWGEQVGLGQKRSWANNPKRREFTSKYMINWWAAQRGHRKSTYSEARV